MATKKKRAKKRKTRAKSKPRRKLSVREKQTRRNAARRLARRKSSVRKAVRRLRWDQWAPKKTADRNLRRSIARRRKLKTKRRVFAKLGKRGKVFYRRRLESLAKHLRSTEEQCRREVDDIAKRYHKLRNEIAAADAPFAKTVRIQPGHARRFPNRKGLDARIASLKTALR